MILFKKKPKKTEGPDADTKVKHLKLKWLITVGAAIVVLAAAAIILFVYFGDTEEKSIVQSKFSMNYTVKASDDPLVKVLFVSIRMDIDKLSPERKDENLFPSIDPQMEVALTLMRIQLESGQPWPTPTRQIAAKK